MVVTSDDYDGRSIARFSGDFPDPSRARAAGHTFRYEK